MPTQPGLPARTHEALRALMEPELPAGLLAHIDRVVAVARELARRHGADEATVLLMAQGHDLVRAWGDERWLVEAERRSLPIGAAETLAPVLLHGPLGALLLEERGWVEDGHVLDGVTFHTTGHPAYTTEAWAMFVADKVEPHKLARRPELQKVIDAASRSLEAGALAYLELERADLRTAGIEPHPLAEETLAWLRRHVR
jgi:predicted HD superfamily hydrolase involved in NAD metabolism